MKPRNGNRTAKNNNNKDNREEIEKRKGNCPVCGASIRAGYDTKVGRILICENYPSCKYIIIIGRKLDGN